jgi:hypothetical protein
MAKGKSTETAPASNEAPATETEKETGTAVAVAEAPKMGTGLVGSNFALNGMKFKVIEQVTMPLLKQGDNEAVYVKILSKVFVGKEIKNKRTGEVEQKPAQMVNVVNLENGRPMQYIVNAVLEGTWNDNPKYANGAYVGKSFGILKLPQGEGKRYKNFEVFEIETDGEVAEPAKTA